MTDKNYAIICRSIEEREVCLTQMRKQGYDFRYKLYLDMSLDATKDCIVYFFNHSKMKIDGWMDRTGWYVENGWIDEEIECSEIFHNQLIQRRINNA